MFQQMITMYNESTFTSFQIFLGKLFIGARPVLFSYRHGRHDGGTQLVEGAHLTAGDTRFCRESSKSRGFHDRGSENPIPQ